jgi:hypothetical protein
MKLFDRLTITALVFLCLGIALPVIGAVGQQAGRGLKVQLIGTCILVANYTEREDGTKFDTFGPKPIGLVKFDADGRLSLLEMRSDLPKFAGAVAEIACR